MFNKAVLRVIAPIIKALEDRIKALEEKAS